MAWFIGQSAVTIAVAFVLGGLVAWLIWGRRLRLLVTEVRGLRGRVAECDAEHLPALRAAQLTEAGDRGGAAGLHIPSPRAETTSVSVPPPPGANLVDVTTVEITHGEAALAGASEEDDEHDDDAEHDDAEATETLATVDAVETGVGTATTVAETDETTEVTGTVADELAVVEAVAAEPAIDDLARIEGIGPKFAGALVAAGYRTYDQLASADATSLIAAIRAAGLSFAPSLPTWSQQARLLADGDEEGFAALTARLIAGRDVTAHPDGLPADDLPADETPADDLARIEGIGPKISGALVAAGIRTFQRLSETDEVTLKDALASAGLTFAPSAGTWAQQAKLLADGDEEGFAVLTARLVAGRDIDDDLERIEGIGPKFAAALRAAGIRSYRSLARADGARLRGAIERAGMTFAPSMGTWAQQAQLLADGDEEGFADLTRRLVAGRDEGRA